MGIFNALFVCFFLYSAQFDIIRDLPYNVNHEENMDVYVNKYIPKGTKFFIRFPLDLNCNITFILKICKNINFFPIYSEDFLEFPNDKEIVNTNFKNEIPLTKKEDLEYSTYSFNIIKNKNEAAYKAIYFQNNEILNFISFGLYTDFQCIFIEDLSLDGSTYIDRLMNKSYYYFVAAILKDDRKFEIKIHSKPLNKGDSIPYYVNARGFIYQPGESELIYKEGYYIPADEDDVTEDGDFEERTFKCSTYDHKFFYLAIEIYTYVNIEHFTIYLSADDFWSSNTWKIIISIIAGIIILVCIFTVFGVKGCPKNFCLCFIGCCK